MLPGFIIDQIRKREEDERRRDAPLREQLPIPEPRPARQKPDDQQDRGVIIIDL